MVQETIYKVIEREVEKVPLCWKVVHISLYTIAAILSFCATFFYQQFLYSLGDNCPLYPILAWENDSSLYYEPVGAFPNGTASFFNAQTHWGQSSLCTYCQYVLMYGGIVAVILTAFCFMCSRGGAGYKNDLMERPFQMVLPMTIITLIATICVAVMYFQLIGGLGQFCAQFIHETQSESCDEQLNIYTLLFHETKLNSYLYLTLTKWTTLIVFLSWILQFIILTSRIITAPDFIIIRSRFFKQKKERQRSVNSYEDSEIGHSD